MPNVAANDTTISCRPLSPLAMPPATLARASASARAWVASTERRDSKLTSTLTTEPTTTKATSATSSWRVGERPHADGVGEQHVEDQRRPDRGRHRRPDAADHRNRRDEQQVHEHVAGQVEVAPERQQHDAHERQPDGHEQPAGELAAAREVWQAPPGERTGVGIAIDGAAHDVHVDLTGLVQTRCRPPMNGRARSTADATGRSDDQLGRPLALGEPHQGVTDVAAPDIVILATQVGEQLLVGAQLRGVRSRRRPPPDCSGLSTWTPMRSARARSRDVGGSPYHPLARSRFGHRDDHPIALIVIVDGAGRPTPTLERVLDRVGHPQQGQLTERGQALDAEVVAAPASRRRRTRCRGSAAGGGPRVSCRRARPVRLCAAPHRERCGPAARG